MRNTRIGTATLFAVAILLAGHSLSWGEDAYYRVRVGDLKFSDGAIPKSGDRWSGSAAWTRRMAMQPGVAIVGEGEAYIVDAPSPGASLGIDDNWNNYSLVLRTAAGKEVAGRLALPRSDGSGMELLKFTLPATSADPKFVSDFNKQKAAYYRQLTQRNVPGTAWFRHQSRVADANANVGQTPENARPQWEADEELVRQFSLFSGGRALSENLQLDRQLAATKVGEAAVDISTLTGITVAEIDWKPLIKDADPKLDALASAIPSDQQVVFFPSFAAMAKLADEARSREGGLLRSGRQLSEDARSIDWYERQLGVSLDGLSRVLGPKLVTSAAITGSDPYFPTGTDVAVLLATTQPQVLKGLLAAQMQLAAAKNPKAKAENGEVAGVYYSGFRSPDRRTSGYVAELPGAVVVTNSLAQLERLAGVSRKSTPAVVSLDEFKFFRARYPLGDADETAFVFLSDATIRRLCSPRWRIATARRTYVAAVLAELQAQNLDALVNGNVKAGPLQSDFPLVNAGELSISARGIFSTAQGSLDWQTPIAELDLKQVTSEEAAGYNRWRDQYQSNWRWAFDPIGLRIGASDRKFSADLTVMPLIAGTDYRQFIEVSKGTSLKEDSGDRHGAPLQFALAINKNSALFQQGRNMASVLSPDPFGWLGSSVSIYVDDDPLWEELQKLTPEELQKKAESIYPRLPIAIRAEVSNGLKLTAFLATVRAFIDQAAPGMVTWENRTHRDLPYVRIAPTQQAQGMLGDANELAIYYAPSAEDLVISPNEAVIKHSLERRLARQAKKEKPATEEKSPALKAEIPWLGKNLCIQIDRRAFEFLSRWSAQDYQAMVQVSSWNNLPILNEWKRRFPKQDPVELHEKFWHARLICPAGGKYVWNEDWQTMESTACGHPGQPKSGPALAQALSTLEAANFGVTFEEQGLRGRVELQRQTKKP